MAKPKQKSEEYSEKESQMRFEAALKGGLNTPHKPLKEKPKVRAGSTVALNQRVNDLLAHTADLLAVALAAMLIGFFAADESCISFDDLAIAATSDDGKAFALRRVA